MPVSTAATHAIQPLSGCPCAWAASPARSATSVFNQAHSTTYSRPHTLTIRYPTEPVRVTHRAHGIGRRRVREAPPDSTQPHITPPHKYRNKRAWDIDCYGIERRHSSLASPRAIHHHHRRVTLHISNLVPTSLPLPHQNRSACLPQLSLYWNFARVAACAAIARPVHSPTSRTWFAL